MARALGIAEETYRLLETTGRRGTRAHYDRARDDWAAPAFGTDPERVRAALRRTEEYWPVLREERWQRIREADPEWAAMVERTVKRAPCRRSGRRSASSPGLLCGWGQG